MTDHPTPATPEATEREAREEAVRDIYTRIADNFIADGETMASWEEQGATSQAFCVKFASAVSAATLARCRAAVEGLRGKHEPLCNTNRPAHAGGPTDCDCYAEPFNAALDAALRALGEGA